MAGGKREGAGRKPNQPEIPQQLHKADRGLATRVLAKNYTRVLTLTDKHGKTSEEKVAITEEDLWLEHLHVVGDADHRLRALIYLTDKRDGKPAQSMITTDNRESARELDFGDLPMPASPVTRKAGKPN